MARLSEGVGWMAFTVLLEKQITDSHGIPISSEFDQDLAVGVRQYNAHIDQASENLQHGQERVFSPILD
jgi:hypothetical protein